MSTLDPYATLGVAPTAKAQEIKRAYRTLARRYHPDVSQEPDAEARFKDIALAYEAVGTPDKRAAHDAEVDRANRPAPRATASSSQGNFGFGDFDGDSGFGQADWLEALLAQQGLGGAARGARRPAPADQHARVSIDLRDAYRGSQRTVQLSNPVQDAQGRITLLERRLEVQIPKGMRDGQHLRLAGQGGSAFDGQPAGDLYLEIAIAPASGFRVDDRDVFTDLKLAPWEAALGARLDLPTPDGRVEVTVPPGSAAGRRLRLKGQGIPATPPGDLYAELSIVLPPADGDAARHAYEAFSRGFPDFDPRHSKETSA